MNRVDIQLDFGALAPKIHEQLRAQGVRYGPAAYDAVGHFQLDADSITRLDVRGLIPDGQVARTRTKLFKRILQMVADLTVANPSSGSGE